MDGEITLVLSAFGLGMLHALEPGHGKTLMVGSLINSKRKWLDPVYLASSTAFGHIIGMILFTSISFFLAHKFVPAEIKMYFEIAIALTILMVGCWQFLQFQNNPPKHSSSCSCCSKTKLGPQSNHLPAIGMLVGLVPCPSAIALSVSAITIGSLTQAVIVCGVFGSGVAVALLLVGVAVTFSSERLKALPGVSRFQQLSKYISPAFLVLMGTVMLFHASSHHH